MTSKMGMQVLLTFFVDDLKELEKDKYTVIPYKDYNEFATKFKDAALVEKNGRIFD